jgi:predicted HTH domain antitoxin
VRIPGKLGKEILEIIENERLDKDTFVKTLFEMGIVEWRKQIAIESLRDGKVTFAKTAKMARLSLWEFADLVKERKVEWVGHVENGLEKEIRKSKIAEKTMKKPRKDGFGALKGARSFTAEDEMATHE